MQNNTEDVDRLSDLYDDIKDLQIRYFEASPLNKQVIARALREAWIQLDSVCNDMYELSDDETSNIMAIGRTTDRVTLLNGAE